jgi:hypothetical protein
LLVAGDFIDETLMAEAETLGKITPAEAPEESEAITRLRAYIGEVRIELLAEIKKLKEIDGPVKVGIQPEQQLEVKGLGQSARSVEVLESATEYDNVNDTTAIQLCDSVWDASILIGLPGVHVGQSLLTICCFLLNILIQVLFIAVLWNNVVEDRLSEDKLADYQRWRNSEGHSYRYVDPVTQVSLVARVCGLDFGMSLAGSQRDLYDDLDKYYGDDKRVLSRKPGEWLSILALTVFVACILVEMRRAFNYILAISAIPAGPRTKLVTNQQGDFKFAQMSVRRKLWCCFVGVLRVSVASVLVFPGAKWLAWEINLENLILNCSALGFILEIDEIIFELGAPLRIAGLLRHMETLPLTRRRWLAWIPVGFLLSLVILVSTLASIWLAPTWKNMSRAMDILCDGWQDMAYGIDPLDGLMFAETQGFKGDNISDVIRAHNLSVYCLYQAENFDNAAGLGIAQTVHLDKIATYKTFKNSEFVTELADCEDHANPGAYLFATTYNKTYGECESSMAFDSCSKVAASGLCIDDSTTGRNARHLCPEACNCTRPDSGLLYFAIADEGCPMSQCQSKERTATTYWWRGTDGGVIKLKDKTNSSHNESVAVMNATEQGCYDMKVQDLTKAYGWRLMLRLLRRGTVAPDNWTWTFPNTQRIHNKSCVEALNKTGCAALNTSCSQNDKTWLCMMGGTSKSSVTESEFLGGGGTAWWCPQACGCASEYLPLGGVGTANPQGCPSTGAPNGCPAQCRACTVPQGPPPSPAPPTCCKGCNWDSASNNNSQGSTSKGG